VWAVLPAWSQKEVNLVSSPKKVTLFFEGAQIVQGGKVNLVKGRQLVVFKKLTDELDKQSVRVKGTGDFTILSVKTRKNFEDEVSGNSELEELNKRKKEIEKSIDALIDEDNVYRFDQTVLNANYNLKGDQVGVKIAELKEASLFFHTKMNEITTQRRRIQSEIDKQTLELNKIAQEIIARRSKPIINYSEVVVEVEANSTISGDFELTYISPAASWTPYYDLRAEGINKPIRLESKAKVRQNTGIDWENVDLVLSTNNPYENAQEPTLKPLYLFYNNYNYAQPSYTKRDVTKDYSGQTIRGQVIDRATGEALPFCNVTIPGTSTITQTDFDGKFSINVPQGYNNITIASIGYRTVNRAINSAYLKVFIDNSAIARYDNSGSGEVSTLAVRSASEVAGKVAGVTEGDGMNVRGLRSGDNSTYYYIDGIKVRGSSNLPKASIEEIEILTGGVPANYGDEDIMQNSSYSRNEYARQDYKQDNYESSKKEAETAPTTTIQKDMRVEYVIDTKYSIPADGSEYGVNITTYDLQANFEYHAVPKIDPSVFLVAGVYGWEKYNLLSAQTNLYFDGTFIGTSDLDASSTKDTINFSLGKEGGIVITRKKVDAMSKEKLIGDRKKVDATYEIEVRNNSGSDIPLLIKDQFPISQDADIKVKQGLYTNATLDEKTGILLWKMQLKVGEKSTVQFNYSVDYYKGKYLRIE